MADLWARCWGANGASRQTSPTRGFVDDRRGHRVGMPRFGSGPGTGCGSIDKASEQPARPDDLRVVSADPCSQRTIGGGHDDLAVGPGDGRDRVVTLTRGMDDRHTAHVGLRCPGARLAFEHDGHRLAEPPRGHRRTDLRREGSGRTRPIAPPSGGAGPDDVSGVDHQHTNSVAHAGFARSRLSGPPSGPSSLRSALGRAGWRVGGHREHREPRGTVGREGPLLLPRPFVAFRLP